MVNCTFIDRMPFRLTFIKGFKSHCKLDTRIRLNQSFSLPILKGRRAFTVTSHGIKNEKGQETSSVHSLLVIEMFLSNSNHFQT